MRTSAKGHKQANNKGFTLVELMIVVAIVGILAAIAVPKLGSAIRKSQESSTRANLAALRASLAMYYTDHEGVYPTDDLTSLVTGGYIRAIPTVIVPRTDSFGGHPSGKVVGAGSYASWGASTGNWYYFNVPNDPTGFYSRIVVNCGHPDSTGVNWDTR